MLTRKTQYAWMALGGLICLFGLILACKLRDGNQAIAQGEKPAVAPPYLAPSDEPAPPLPIISKSISPASPHDKMSKPGKVLSPKPKGDPLLGSTAAPPLATLEMPLPDIAPKKPMDGPPPSSLSKTEPAPLLPPMGGMGMGGGAAASPPAFQPSGVNAPAPLLPVSFGPNTPTAPEKKPTAPPLPSSLFVVPGPALISGDKKTSKLAPPSIADSPPPPPSSAADKKSSSLDSLRTLIKKTTTENTNDTKLSPAAYAPVTAAPPSAPPAGDHETCKSQPGEPPLAPAPGPVQLYHVHGSETLQDIARRTLGSGERVSDLHKLNPSLKPDSPLSAGVTVRLPADACVQSDDIEPIKPLPALRPRPAAPKTKVLPLTGTYQCSLDEHGQLTLPRAIREQLNSSDTVLLSPGPDKCLWLTNQPHLERLGERLDQSQAREADVRVFKRLYFAQTERLTVNDDGRVAVPERLSQFAGLHQEVVLVGIDDHFEVWDAAHWRQYTQQKSTTGRASAPAESE